MYAEQHSVFFERGEGYFLEQNNDLPSWWSGDFIRCGSFHWFATFSSSICSTWSSNRSSRKTKGEKTEWIWPKTRVFTHRHCLDQLALAVEVVVLEVQLNNHSIILEENRIWYSNLWVMLDDVDYHYFVVFVDLWLMMVVMIDDFSNHLHPTTDLLFSTSLN